MSWSLSDDWGGSWPWKLLHNISYIIRFDFCFDSYWQVFFITFKKGYLTFITAMKRAMAVRLSKLVSLETKVLKNRASPWVAASNGSPLTVSFTPSPIPQTKMGTNQKSKKGRVLYPQPASPAVLVKRLIQHYMIVWSVILYLLVIKNVVVAYYCFIHLSLILTSQISHYKISAVYAYSIVWYTPRHINFSNIREGFHLRRRQIITSYFIRTLNI